MNELDKYTRDHGPRLSKCHLPAGGPLGRGRYIELEQLLLFMFASSASDKLDLGLYNHIKEKGAQIANGGSRRKGWSQGVCPKKRLKTTPLRSQQNALLNTGIRPF